LAKLIENIDDNLRIHSKRFWKYVSKFNRNDQSINQIGGGYKVITESQRIAEEFADHFFFIFNSSSSVNNANSSDSTSDFLNVAHISESSVKRAISRPR
jgi:hypothetical protein